MNVLHVCAVQVRYLVKTGWTLCLLPSMMALACPVRRVSSYVLHVMSAVMQVRYLVKTGEELPERSFKQPVAEAESSSSDSSASEPPAGDAPPSSA
jgi:hypothetical protein